MADWKRIRAAVDAAWDEGAMADALVRSYVDAFGGTGVQEPSWVTVFERTIGALNKALEEVQSITRQEEGADA